MRRPALLLPVLALALGVASAAALVSGAHSQGATPAADCPVTTDEENEAIARRWHEDTINGHELAVIDEIVADDIVHHAGTFPDGVGGDAVKLVLGTLLTGFPDVQHTIEDVVATDDLVIIRFTATGTQTGEFQGHAPTGNPATWTGINIFRLECGRIVEEWSEVDGLGRLEQLGLIGTPTP